MGVDVSTAHRDVKNVLEALAKKYGDGDERIRALLNERYEELFHAYHDEAVGGDTEAAKMVVGVMERVVKINGVVPDRPMVAVNQRAMKFAEPVTFKIEGDRPRIDELAESLQEYAVGPVIPESG